MMIWYCVTNTYKKDTKRVWQSFHNELAILKIIFFHFEHSISVYIRHYVDTDDWCECDECSCQVELTCSQSDNQRKNLAEPKDKVECFHLRTSRNHFSKNILVQKTLYTYLRFVMGVRLLSIRHRILCLNSLYDLWRGFVVDHCWRH